MISKIKHFLDYSIENLQYLWRFVRYLRRFRLKIILISLLTIISSVLALLYPLIFQTIIDKTYPNRDFNQLWKMILIALGILVTLSVARSIVKYLSASVHYKLNRHMQIKLFKAIDFIPLSYLENCKSNKLIERLTYDTNAVSEVLVRLISEIVSIPAVLIISFLLMARINIMIAFSILAIIPFHYIVSMITETILQKLNLQLRNQVEEVKTQVDNSFRGVFTTRLFLTQKKTQKKQFINALRDKFNLDMDILHKSLIFEKFDQLLTSGWVFVLSCFGLFLMFHNKIKMGDTMALGIYAAILVRPFNQILSLYKISLLGSVSARRLCELFKESRQSTSKILLTEDDIKLGLSIDSLSFAYPGSQLCINKLSLNVNVGETIVIVGHNGSGKTTFLKLLAKFYEEYNGQIKFGNKELREINRRNYIEKISAVIGPTYFIDGTIIDNCKSSDSNQHKMEVKNIAEILGFHDWIEQLKYGYDTRLGANCIKLSAGEAKKLSILRAFSQKPSLLLLDEISSNMDEESECRLIEGLKKMNRQNLITILVTHRLAIAKQPWIDRILVFQDGKIVQTKCPNDNYEILI